MKKEQILLSISILMSGRKETKKCLDSLKPLMSEIPCELILVDTGCDEDTRKLIETYTDNIITFEWCKDFSKARNAGLKKATGKWFLYLDDDEWFEDPSEIIEFFKSGEYKKYHSGCYVQRNYNDYIESDYTDCLVSRMIELRKETRFYSSIHEYMEPFYGPAKLFNTYVKHFGYIFNNPEEKYNHAKRNVELLIDMMNKKPMELRWDMQILQEYSSMGENEKIIEIAQDAIRKFHRLRKDQRTDRVTRTFGSFYAYLVDAYDRKFDYDKEIETFDKALKEKDLGNLSIAYMCTTMTMMYFRREEYEKAIETFKTYIDVYKKIAHDKDEMYRQGALLVESTFQKTYYEDMLLHGIMASVKLGQDEILEEYFYQLGWKDSRMLLHPSLQKIVITHMAEAPFRESYINMAKTMAERVNNISSVIPILKEIEGKYRSASKDTEECEEKKQFFRIVRIFSHVDHSHWYITYLRILNAKEEGNMEEIPSLYDKLFAHVFDMFNLDKAIWEIAEEAKVEMEPFFLRVDFDTWRNGICQWMENSDRADIAYKEKMIQQWKRTDSFWYDFLDMKIKEGYLLHPVEGITFEEIEKELFDFAHAEDIFYRHFFKEETFDSFPEALPQECRIAERLLEVEKARMISNDSKAMEKMKNLAGVYEPLKDTIKLYARKFGEYVKKKEQTANAARMEILKLAEEMKEKVQILIANGKEEEAQNILLQLSKFVPDDEEIKLMMRKDISVYH